MKESAFQPTVIAESSQVVKESASQPNIIAENSQVEHIDDLKIPELAHQKNLYSSSVNISPKILQNAKELW